MSQHKHHGIALLIGVPLTIIALWLQPLLASASVEMMMRGGAIAFATAATTKVAIQAVLLAPGFLVGWVAGTRGTILGLAAGAFGSLIYSVAFATTLQTPANPYLPNPWSWVVGEVLTQAILAAVAGAAGQLLRSNKSLERTRER
jgi:hypothetical protein